MAKKDTAPKMNGGFWRIFITLQGAFPGIMFDPMTDGILDGIDNPSKRKAKDTTSTLAEICAAKIPMTEDEKVGLPRQYLYSALKEAGRGVPGAEPKTKITNAKGKTMVYSIITSLEAKDGNVEDLVLPFSSVGEMIPDRRAGRNKQGQATVCKRPLFRDWKLELVVDVDTEVIDLTKIRKLFEIAGTAVGLGSFRPVCGGPFGKFKIAYWETKALEIETAAAA